MNMDISQIGYTLNNFLNKNENILMEEHYAELKRHFDFLLQFKNSTQIETADYGFHWTVCPYTSNSCDSYPDTCPCIVAEIKMCRIVKIMKLYNKM